MEMKNYLEEIKAEIRQEDFEKAKSIVKERLREIQSAKRVLEKMEKQLEIMLEKKPCDIL